MGENKPNSTSRHRADALTRLGHKTIIMNPYLFCNRWLENKIIGGIHYRSGYKLLQNKIGKWTDIVIQEYAHNPPDLVWINSGELLGHAAITKLRQLNCPIILYMNDDPIGGRDGNRFDSLLNALPSYDLCVVVRNLNISEFLQFGARKVIRVNMSYDEINHQSIQDITRIPSQFHTDVVFIGTWMRFENRDFFILHLIESGINVSIWGDRWQKSSIWTKLKSHWRGNSLYGQEYVMAIQGAKICLGLLSKGNRDFHTTRSMEIPFAGGLLCAERTLEHLQLYQEDKEAVFWDDEKECAQKCLDLLKDSKKREEIRLSGMKRVLENRVGNEDICQQIINAVLF